jgi:subtilisin family serine protease
MKPPFLRYGAIPLLLSTLAAFLLQGCGGGGGSESPEGPEQRECRLTLRERPPLLPYDANPYFEQQWYFHYDEAFYDRVGWEYGIVPDPDASIHPPSERQRYTGKGIKVAIIDDALDLSHEDLVGAVKKVYDVETGTEAVCPTDDDLNHGTEITGIIGADSNDKGIGGIAPEAEIYFIRLPFEGAISTSQIVEAFEKAKEWNVDVINCSWGSGQVSESVQTAIEDLADHGRHGKGTVIVFAAGNGGWDQTGDPIGEDEASLPAVIAVGATTIENRRASYSDYGDSLDLMAPGGQYLGIPTLDQMGRAGQAEGDRNYLLYNDPDALVGTSASAPIVTAVVARMLEAAPDLNRTEVYSLLIGNAEKMDREDCEYNASGFSPKCGYGKVNLRATIEAVTANQR